MKNVLKFLNEKISILFEVIKKIDDFLNTNWFITMLIWIVLFVYQNFILESESLMKGFVFILLSILSLTIIDKLKIKSIIFIFGIITFSMININSFQNNSYSWVKITNDNYKKASTVYFNLKFWKNPNDLIIRNDDFGSHEDIISLNPIHIKIKNGDFIIHRYAYVKVSRKTWEEFNFSEKDLRNFLEKEIKEKILKSFDQCSIEKITGLNMFFKYNGRKCISADILNKN